MNITRGLVSLAITCALLAGVAPTQAAAAAVPAATTASTMTVTRGITLNVRSGAGTSYSVRGSLEGGSTVSGFDQGNGWFKLDTGQYAGGYVSLSYLSPVPGTPTTPTGPTTPGGSFHGTVVKTLMKTLVHATPSVATGYVRTLAPGAAVSRTVQGGWLELDGGGYVSRALVTDKTLSNGALPAPRLCDVPIAWNSPGSWEPGYTPATVRKLNCVALKSLTGWRTRTRHSSGATPASTSPIARSPSRTTGTRSSAIRAQRCPGRATTGSEWRSTSERPTRRVRNSVGGARATPGSRRTVRSGAFATPSSTDSGASPTTGISRASTSGENHGPRPLLDVDLRVDEGPSPHGPRRCQLR